MVMHLLRLFLLGSALSYASAADATFFPPSVKLSNPVNDRQSRDDIKVYPNVVDEKELANILASVNGAYLHEGDLPRIRKSHVEVEPHIIAVLRGRMGGLPVADTEQVPVTIVDSKSSLPHTDFVVNLDTNQRTFTEYTAMLVVDIIGDAFFNYGDVSIPLEAGMLLHFDGSVPHFTNIEDGGRVTYLGSLNWFKPNGDRHLNIMLKNILDSSTKAAAPIRRNVTRRRLSEVNANETETDAVNGTAAIGHLVNKTTKEIVSNFLNIHADGLPSNCSDCEVKVAIADSEACTTDSHDKATFILIQEPLTYATNELGSTSAWNLQSFTETDTSATTNSLPVTLAQLLLEEISEYKIVVFLYDQDGSLVACSHLQLLSDEKAAEYDTLFNGLWTAAASEGSSDVTSSTSNTGPEAKGSENPSLGNNTLLSAFAMVICMLMGAFLVW